MDTTLLAKAIVALVVVAAVVLDWPRALAGLLLGYVGRRERWPLVAVVAGVALIALGGEMIYALIGRTAGMSWFGFIAGCIAAGATAVGLLRVMRYIAEDVEAP